MSRAAVVEFCQEITKTLELRTRLESGVKAGAGWELIVSVANEHGYEFTVNEAAECFEHERQCRASRESASHAETHILKQSPVFDPHVAETFILREGPGPDGDAAVQHSGVARLNSLRRIALSHDWSMALSDTAAADDESIFS